MKIFFFHGNESSPTGPKYQYLNSWYPGIESPDFRGMDMEERLQAAQALIEALEEPVTIVGSSMGGLQALLLSQRIPDKIQGLVLLAPAFGRSETENVAYIPDNMYIIHGLVDDVVPFPAALNFGSKHVFPILAVDDNHHLSKRSTINLIRKVLDKTLAYSHN